MSAGAALACRRWAWAAGGARWAAGGSAAHPARTRVGSGRHRGDGLVAGDDARGGAQAGAPGLLPWAAPAGGCEGATLPPFPARALAAVRGPAPAALPGGTAARPEGRPGAAALAAALQGAAAALAALRGAAAAGSLEAAARERGRAASVSARGPVAAGGGTAAQGGRWRQRGHAVRPGVSVQGRGAWGRGPGARRGVGGWRRSGGGVAGTGPHSLRSSRQACSCTWAATRSCPAAARAPGRPAAVRGPAPWAPCRAGTRARHAHGQRCQGTLPALRRRVGVVPEPPARRGPCSRGTPWSTRGPGRVPGGGRCWAGWARGCRQAGRVALRRGAAAGGCRPCCGLCLWLGGWAGLPCAEAATLACWPVWRAAVGSGVAAAAARWPDVGGGGEARTRPHSHAPHTSPLSATLCACCAAAAPVCARLHCCKPATHHAPADRHATCTANAADAGA